MFKDAPLGCLFEFEILGTLEDVSVLPPTDL